MATSLGDQRWAAHLVSDLHAPSLLVFRRGRSQRLLLIDDRGRCVDGRAVRPGEEIEKEISFPCHVALVGSVRLGKPHVVVPYIDQYIEVTRQSSYRTIYGHLYKDYTYTTVYLYT